MNCSISSSAFVTGLKSPLRLKSLIYRKFFNAISPDKSSVSFINFSSSIFLSIIADHFFIKGYCILLKMS